MTERIIDGTEFNAENIIYTQPKVHSQGGKSVNILSKTTKTTLTLLTPLMLTWGASDFKKEGEEQGNGRFELSLQFPSKEYSSTDTDLFLKNIKDLENKIKKDALINSREWFGKVHKSSEIIDELFTPILKYPKDKHSGEYNYSKDPTIRLKLPQWEGVWKIEIYDENSNKLYPTVAENSTLTPLDYLKKGTNIACLIQFAGIWFVNGKFSVSWKLIQAVVQKPRAQLHGTCHIKLKTQDKDKLTSQKVGLDDDVEESAVVLDSDNEEEEATNAPVPVSAPAPVPVSAPVKETAQDTENEPSSDIKKQIIKKK